MAIYCIVRNKNSELSKRLEQITDNPQALNIMYDVVARLQEEGLISKKVFNVSDTKYFYTIPKRITEKSLAQKDTPWGLDEAAFQKLQKRIIEENAEDWLHVKVAKTLKSYLISFTEPDLNKLLPEPIVFDDFLPEEYQESKPELIDEDTLLSEQMLLEQELAEDREVTVNRIQEEVNRKSNQEIKPGVAELFESNPELASQIYEAVGFSLSSVNLELNQQKNRINAVLKSNKNEAKIDIDIEGKYAHITNTNVLKGQQGFGTLSYIKLANELINKGLILTSDLNGLDLQESGKALWESLVNKNLAIYNSALGRYIFTGQQAQQLYSSYLDTIFPDSKVKDIVYHGSYSKNIDKFNKQVEGRTSLTGFLPKGFYFTNQQYVASTYTAPKDVYNKAVWSSLVNFIEGIKDQYGEYLQDPSSFEKLLSYIGKSDNQKEFIIDYRDGKLEDSFGGAAEAGLFLPSKEDTELYLRLIKNKDLEGIKKKRDEYSSEEGNIYPSILNIKTPLYKKSATGSITTINLEGRTTGEKKATLQKELKNSDGLVISDIRDSSDYKSNKNIKYNENIDEQTYVVFEPEQTHILGSKQDIEGFKEFVQEKQYIPEGTQLNLFEKEYPDIKTIEEFDKKFPNFASLQPFEKMAIIKNMDKLDVKCKL